MNVLNAGDVDKIPLEVLFGNPEKAGATLSPGGEQIGYLAPHDGVLNIWVRTLGQHDDRRITDDADRGIRSYFWAYDDEHILYLQDVGGNENWRLYSVHLKSGEVRDLTPFENVQVRIETVDKNFPNEVLLSMNKENPSLHDMYHLDLKSGELKLIAKNPGDFSDWLVDARLKVRGALRARAAGGSDFLVRETEEAPWKAVLSWDSSDSMGSFPVSFTKDGQAVYLKYSRDSNTSRLVQFNPKTGDVQTLVHDKDVDVGGVMLHPDTYEVQMVTFLRDRLDYQVKDPLIQSDIDAIQNIRRGDFAVSARSRKDDKWLVSFHTDNGPASFYIYERKTHKSVFLFETKPDIKKYPLSKMEPISFKSRDGLTLHGYLTFPPRTGKKNLPMVLNVHGGPWARDAWGFDPEVQWLANRGYVCLQVNFRGSVGYGKAFVNAGSKEWGGKMHDDLVDAVKWAVGQGYADPKRIAIYGGSYGGYAALVGAAFTPDLFTCAVDIVGPSNLITFINTVPPYWSVFLEELYQRVGNPKTEEDFLKSRSPLFKVDDIKIPMLIAQGANDPRVKKEESEQIVAAMKAKGIDVDYLLFADEGHGFAKPKNRLKFYAACEKFLAKHLTNTP